MKIDAIADGFINLLTANPYEKISIRMICDSVNVSRNAFYYHFDNKEALVEWICCRDFMKFTTPYFYIRMDNITAKSFLDYFLKKKEFYTAVYAADNGRLLRHCLEKTYAAAPAPEKIREDTPSPQGARYKIHPKIFRCYSCAGIAAVVLFWIGHGMKTPVEDIARDLNLLISQSPVSIWDKYLV
jgi:hypothetical protein